MKSLGLLSLLVIFLSSTAAHAYKLDCFAQTSKFTVDDKKSASLEITESAYTIEGFSADPIAFHISSKTARVWRGGTSAWTEYSIVSGIARTVLIIRETHPWRISVESYEGATLKGSASYLCQ